MKELESHAKTLMQKSIESLKHEYATMRTGIASPSVLDKVTVTYYGAEVPLKQLASVVAPEPKLLEIKPWDPKVLVDIEKAIQKSSLGLNPQNDGKIIRIPIPSLSQQRRQELAKIAHKIAEDHRISIRNARREVTEEAKKRKNSGKISEDDLFHFEKEINRSTEQYLKEIEDLLKHKEQELLTV